jgi:hypothetical protein
LGDFSVGTLSKHTQFPGSWFGTEHYKKGALVFGCPCLPLGYVMDKQLGNTGGLGGILGIFYAIG